MGWWASDTATLYFDNVRVPVSNLNGLENQGFKVIMTNFNCRADGYGGFNGRPSVGSVWKRPLPGRPNVRRFGKRLADHQVIRHKIAMMKQKLNATQAYIRMCYEAIEAG